ncbi:Histone-lysine N-methyltransferase SETMAR [Eumeta japonica]|uniref:Histone-lysine N-methyltransferase SETMAR n=1 Tax=Eumeta variegata TaxID=151549 RepID=A0A4C1U2V2_EUMVA|nr:Histone-lysine N-methyltransferase SETMAR [Eumeta japonica]
MSAESSNFSNIEHRAVIKYFAKKGKTPKEIFEDMVSVLQESAPSYTMVEKWARLFQQGRESCGDDPRPGRPVTALKDTGFSEIDHPPYSPDLAPSDYFLFSNLKKELRGRRFVDDNQMKMAVESQRKGIFFGRFEGVIHQILPERKLYVGRRGLRRGPRRAGRARFVFNPRAGRAGTKAAPGPAPRKCSGEPSDLHYPRVAGAGPPAPGSQKWHKPRRNHPCK